MSNNCLHSMIVLVYDLFMSTVLDDLQPLGGRRPRRRRPVVVRFELGSLATRVRSWLDAFDTRLVRRMNAAEPERDPAEPLRHRGRREANAVKDRATTTEQVPQMGAALADGSITAGHVDALTRASNTLDDAGRERLAEHGEQLAGDAAAMTPEQFARHCARLARNLASDDGVSHHEHVRQQRHVHRWICHETGLHKTLIAVDALTDAKLWNVLGAVVDTARAAKQDDDVAFAHVQCDAIVDHIVNGRCDGDRRTRRRGHRARRPGLAARRAPRLSVCETSDGAGLPVDTVRRLCCDAVIVPAVIGTDGELLDLGRTTRLANRTQRRALRAMYRTCGMPDCDVPFERCRIHHVVFWEHGGTSEPRQPRSVVRDPSPSRPRGRLAPVDDRRPCRPLVPARRHRRPPRHHHRPLHPTRRRDWRQGAAATAYDPSSPTTTSPASPGPASTPSPDDDPGSGRPQSAIRHSRRPDRTNETIPTQIPGGPGRHPHGTRPPPPSRANNRARTRPGPETRPGGLTVLARPVPASEQGGERCRGAGRAVGVDGAVVDGAADLVGDDRGQVLGVGVSS